MLDDDDDDDDDDVVFVLSRRITRCCQKCLGIQSRGRVLICAKQWRGKSGSAGSPEYFVYYRYLRPTRTRALVYMYILLLKQHCEVVVYTLYLKTKLVLKAKNDVCVSTGQHVHMILPYIALTLQIGKNLF